MIYSIIQDMDPKLIAILSGLIAMTGWGLTDIFAKKAIDKIGHELIIIYTGIPTILVTGLLLIIKPVAISFSLNQALLLLLLALLDLAAYMFLYKAYSVGKVSILNPISSAYTIPAFAFSALILGERIGLIEGLCIAAIIFGVILTSLNFKELRDGLQGDDFARGVPLGILTAITWGVVLPTYDLALEGVSWYLASFLLTLIKMLVLIFYNVIILKQQILIKDKQILKSLFWAGLTDGGGNLGLAWGYALSTFTTITTVISSAYPLVLVPTALLFLKEKNSFSQYVGVVLITGGIIIFSLI